ncbi:MAG: hypothetical protein EA379_03035, partial [Phycisphaerales bacterium]
ALAQERDDAPLALAPEPPSDQPIANQLREALELPYLTDDERRALRVFHGLWTREDLDDPRDRARAALIAGVWDDPALLDDRAEPEDRAEAMLRRGDLEEALETLAGRPSIRARRIRAATLESLGRFDDADAAVEPVVSDLLRNRYDDAADIVEGVRALMIRARLREQPARDFHRMRDLLTQARDRMDRLHWPALRAEAELLYDKDNRREAGEASAQLLTLNPNSADALALLGRLSVDAFDFERTRRIAERLDEIARDFTADDDAFSARAAIIRALAWLRQNDPDLAEEEIAPVLTRYPRMRDALAVRAAVQALQHDEPALESALRAFDELSPGSPLALYTAGRALSEARQYAHAAALLERAIKRQPNWPAPHIELGLLELQSGRDLRARDALRTANRLDPFNERTRHSLRLIEELLTYDTVESEHFIVRYRPGVDAVMAREMLEPLEAIHEIVADAIDFTPDRKTIIELMPDHQWFAVRITGMPAIHTIAAATGPVIAMEVPKVGPRHTGEYDWVRVLRHEYVHTVTLARTNNRIPHWFTEAAAVHLEGAPRSFDAARLLARAVRNDDLFDMRAINIAFVRPERPTDRAQAYAQGQWMYEFMIENWGERAPLDLMDRYAEGMREPEAIPDVLQITRDDFHRLFIVWAREQAAAWGMLPDPPTDDLITLARLDTDEGRKEAAEVLAQEGRRLAHLAAGLVAGPPVGLAPRPPTGEIVDALAESHPDHPGVLELKVQAELQRRGGAPDASMIELLETYAAARPVDPTPHRHLARLHLDADDPARAIPHLEFLDAREERSSAYAIELARRYAAIEDFANAHAKAERATQIAPFSAANREFAARVALVRRDFETAERHIAALAALEPDRPQHQRQLDRVRELRAAQPQG